MIDAAQVALVLLAAGRGERFGGGKLAADLQGLPLGLHAAQLFAGFGFAQHLVVTAKSGADYGGMGYDVIINPAPEQGQASSLRLGIGKVRAKACLIALADMPFVTDAHIRALLAGFDGDRIASSCEGRLMPPALFGAAHYPGLMALEGDQGARKLLRGAPFVAADARCLADIDTEEDLKRWR
jgi:molybdenum cofactor cytidylyltransferase